MKKEDLVAWFRAGEKGPEYWGIGTEHEQFLFERGTNRRLSYEGGAGADAGAEADADAGAEAEADVGVGAAGVDLKAEGSPGIAALLKRWGGDDWAPMTESGQVIGLEKEGASITLEPGGQFELSGAKHETVHATWTETKEHFERLGDLGKEMGFYALPMGFDPFTPREEVPWMPKERYRYMRAYMPKKGTLGLDMMTRTCSIQVNVDFESEQDMVRKMQVGQAFQSVVMALFAHSPLTEGKTNGYLSYRSRVWDDTDDDRCGFLPFVLDEDFSYASWVDYLLDVPMYFIYRDGKYYDAEDMTFRTFMAGGAREKYGFEAELADWEVHVSTVFPDIRLKRFIELRGADAGSPEMVTALAAWWVGLLYDAESLSAAHQMAVDLGREAILGLRKEVSKMGLEARFGVHRLHDIARNLLTLAQQGLERRALKLGMASEAPYLDVLDELLTTGKTQAHQVLEAHQYGTFQEPCSCH